MSPYMNPWARPPTTTSLQASAGRPSAATWSAMVPATGPTAPPSGFAVDDVGLARRDVARVLMVDDRDRLRGTVTKRVARQRAGHSCKPGRGGQRIAQRLPVDLQGAVGLLECDRLERAHEQHRGVVGGDLKGT